MIVGLTGRAGSGKTTAQGLFQEQFDGTILDLDSIGHLVLDQDNVKEKLKLAFGSQIVTAENTVDRKVLRKIVFTDQKQLQVLNNIVHPEIRNVVLKSVKQPRPHLIVGALIDEIGLLAVCDTVIVIDAKDEVIARHSPNSIEIFPFQKTREEFNALADIVVKNNFNAQFEKQCLAALKKSFAHE